MSAQDNPPAFPLPVQYQADGMSLRDYFAAKAMQSLILHPHQDQNDVHTAAYKLADLMLKARQSVAHASDRVMVRPIGAGIRPGPGATKEQT